MTTAKCVVYRIHGNERQRRRLALRGPALRERAPRLAAPHEPARAGTLKAKFHYAILVADRSKAGRRPAASLNLAYHTLS